MSKIEKLLERFFSAPKDITWGEAVKVMSYYGFKEMKAGKTGGSRRKFVNRHKLVICLHEPHPRNILKKYQIDLIIQHIQTNEKLL